MGGAKADGQRRLPAFSAPARQLEHDKSERQVEESQARLQMLKRKREQPERRS